MKERAITPPIAVAITSCSPGVRQHELTHQEYADGLIDAGLAESKPGVSWRRATDDEPEHPMTIEPPHRETGVFFPPETHALGVGFDAVRRQQLRLSMSLSPTSSGRISVQVFHVSRDENAPAEVAAVSAEHAGALLVRSQPDEPVGWLRPGPDDELM